ncbi:MAG: hypothetical protein WC455_13415 [Dehalococcoidia bacterium]|jgi:hypothetical protein
MKLREKVEQLASDWHEGGYDEYADALDALLSTADSEQRGLRDAFAALLRSHSWYTTREYERDTTYNNQSRGYQEEALAVRVFEETWGSDALMEALQTGGGKASLTRPAEDTPLDRLRVSTIAAMMELAALPAPGYYDVQDANALGCRKVRAARSWKGEKP